MDRLLGAHGIERDTVAGRQEFERRREARRAEESDEEAWQGIRRGWCLGSAEFKAGLLEPLEGRLGEHDAGELKRESAESKAERIIREELKRLKWGQNDLSQRPKSDPDKPSIAARLRRETTLTLPRIAARLEMGSWKSLNTKLHRWRKINESHENRSRL